MCSKNDLCFFLALAWLLAHSVMLIFFVCVKCIPPVFLQHHKQFSDIFLCDSIWYKEVFTGAYCLISFAWPFYSKCDNDKLTNYNEKSGAI
jgi:hypothetical protein